MLKTFPQMMAELPRSREDATHTLAMPFGNCRVLVRGFADTPKKSRALSADQLKAFREAWQRLAREAREQESASPTTGAAHADVSTNLANSKKRGFASKVRIHRGFNALKRRGSC